MSWYAEAPEDDSLPDIGAEGAMALIRRGIAATPELRVGALLTVGVGLVTALGKIVVPILIQFTLDRGILGDDGFDEGFVTAACAIATLGIVVLYFLNRLTLLRLISVAENALFGLRARTFDHIHRLSMAEHTDSRRGAMVARVTSDIETLARFTQWGALSWILNSAVMVGALVVMLFFSWQLTLVTVGTFVPILPLIRRIQRRQLAAYDELRSAVGDKLSEVSEAVTGAAVVRGYGLEDSVKQRLDDAIDRQYEAHVRADFMFAALFPLADIFAAIALAAVGIVGAINGATWGLSAGELIAFIFLVQLIQSPISELTEVLDQTQIAIAGWRKILATLAVPLDVVDPEQGPEIPDGALGIELESVEFAYRGAGGEPGPLVLHGVTVTIPAGTSVAVVGETGSGKTTVAKLLCRLADPTAGRIRLGGVDVRLLTAAARHRAVRMVPQDGFLFDTTIAENVRLGRPSATTAEIQAAFDALGLGPWLDRLGDGIQTRVGERGGNLSVGERQLVALARAQLAAPGVLILDEATSAVDPETEQALAGALRRLAVGRTVVSIAHRLSTAEAADLVLVMDKGHLVESGHHHDLVAHGGIYARLHESWIGATRNDPDPDPSPTT